MRIATQIGTAFGFVLMVAGGCGGKTPAPVEPAAGPGPAAGPTSTVSPPPATATPVLVAAEPDTMPVVVGATGIPACDAYLAEVTTLMDCDQMPIAARAALADALAQMNSAWTQLSTAPAEAQEAAAEGCAQASEALAQSRSALGC